jgi:hypothetical protein
VHYHYLFMLRSLYIVSYLIILQNINVVSCLNTTAIHNFLLCLNQTGFYYNCTVDYGTLVVYHSFNRGSNSDSRNALWKCQDIYSRYFSIATQQYGNEYRNRFNNFVYRTNVDDLISLGLTDITQDMTSELAGMEQSDAIGYYHFFDDDK